MTPRLRCHTAEDGTETWWRLVRDDRTGSWWEPLDPATLDPAVPRMRADAETQGPGWSEATILVGSVMMQPTGKWRASETSSETMTHHHALWYQWLHPTAKLQRCYEARLVEWKEETP